MENYGLITYREERSIIDENNTPYNQKLTSMLTIAHEMGNYEFCLQVTSLNVYVVKKLSNLADDNCLRVEKHDMELKTTLDMTDWRHQSMMHYFHITNQIFKCFELISNTLFWTAHQYFGNLVTPEFWSAIWLSEGPATLYEFYTVQMLHPEYRTMDLFNIQKLQSVFKTDSLATTKPMNNPGTANVIHKVNIVGKSSFFGRR